ncbi:MAG: AbiU2 domain-containing protein [Sulfuricaulis sp.]
MATPSPINERLETAGDLVVRARIFYDIWWLYEGADTRPQIIDAMNHYPDFFRFDSHAHFVAFVVHLAGLFETRKDTINLPGLVSELAESKLLEPSTVVEAESILSEAMTLIPKVIILRSNLFAHRSGSVSYAEAFRKADVTANQLGDLSSLSLRLVNLLLLARGLEDQIFHTVPRAYLKAMLDAIAKTDI